MEVAIFWFRRDLRLSDNKALFYALKSGLKVVPVFIFDIEILDQLTSRDDARVTFIHQCLEDLNRKLNKLGTTLNVWHGSPLEIWKEVIKTYPIKTVFTNHDYEPYSISRDNMVKELLVENNIEFRTYKDHVIFEKDEVVKADGSPYTVYTPYMKKWRSTLKNHHLKTFNTSSHFDNFLKGTSNDIPSLKSIGFAKSRILVSEANLSTEMLTHYQQQREFPAEAATSRLGIHLRFGTISIRQVISEVFNTSDTFINELIWREFFIQILWHFPEVVSQSFRKQYDRIAWLNNEEDFERWKNGKTGYPLVDAGMRELNSTGYMHNRVRMITASFLCKHLLIDWRWGEAYFAEKLLDYELASNNGNWQWAAGTGCDAAPYFRIFNPTAQQKKFDKDFNYIDSHVPEFKSEKYPDPIVDHRFARDRALKMYKQALNN